MGRKKKEVTPSSVLHDALLKKFIKVAGKNKLQASYRLGVSAQFIGKIVNGKDKATTDWLVDKLELLEVDFRSVIRKALSKLDKMAEEKKEAKRKNPFASGLFEI